jgi:hypothetical protein
MLHCDPAPVHISRIGLLVTALLNAHADKAGD